MSGWVDATIGTRLGRECAQVKGHFSRNLSRKSKYHPYVRERKMLCIDSGGGRSARG